MITHTPGNWHVQLLDRDFLIVHSGGKLRSYVARLHWADLCDEHGDIEANANLIASAPAMLEALERLAHPMADDDDLDYARAIIAKAKGQQ